MVLYARLGAMTSHVLPKSYTCSALLQVNDPGAMTVLQKFEQERYFLDTIRHPHIVQYLGTCHDPESRLPVLLMELMEQSLTRYLEQSKSLSPTILR